MSTVSHPRILPGVLEEREYQNRIVDHAVRGNTLVVLPTGLGKTAIALRVMADALDRRPRSSILFLAPTRPLVLQHAQEVTRTLRDIQPIVLTGAVAPARRAQLLHPPQVIVATPQVIARDLLRPEFDPASISLVVFDEAHRAVGDYPYVEISRALRARGVQVLALTASPGARRERIGQVWEALGIDQFEYRTPADPDVAPYFSGVAVEPKTLPLPVEVQHLAVLLKTVVARRSEALQRLGVTPVTPTSRRELLAVGQRLDQAIAAARNSGDTDTGRLWTARTHQAIAMKAWHGLELIESQGVDSLRQYLARQREDARQRRSAALRGFLEDPDVVDVTRRLEGIEFEHPKIAAATEIVRKELEKNPGGRVIVFTQYRQSADALLEEFRRSGGPNLRAVRFVGQASHTGDPGLKQKEQGELLDRFRKGELNCLVATSVAEEGLDIPSTDLVVLYEPIPDEIRTIQRRGRTGRGHAGRAVVLIAEGTRDVGLWRAAVSREHRMLERLEEVQAAHRRGEAPSTSPVRPTRQKTLFEAPSTP